ncbi:MAG TPA: hypothetical protein VHW00_03695 [Thermoanaerobaculia bacterium]|nr:hypothetical protein [Thermoanaerobaculia bacterium]
MKYAVTLVALLFAACEARVDTPTAEDLRLLLRPQALKSSKAIDEKAVVCAVAMPHLAYRVVSCTYDWSKSSHAQETEAILFFDSTLRRYYSTQDAERGYATTRQAWFEGLKSFHWQQADELLDLGDHHYAAYLMDGETPRGNAFLVRKGSIVMSVLVTGHVLNDRNAVHALLEPLVAEAGRQK